VQDLPRYKYRGPDQLRLFNHQNTFSLLVLSLSPNSLESHDRLVQTDMKCTLFVGAGVHMDVLVFNGTLFVVVG
jgi:hypothetical protein